MDGVFAYVVATLILSPMFWATWLVCEMPPIKRWLNQLALGMPMLRNS